MTNKIITNVLLYATILDAVAIAAQIQAMHVAQQQQNKPLPRYPQSLREMLDSTESQIFLMQVS